MSSKHKWLWKHTADAYVRNDLRVDQRTKLTALLGENEEL
jgi:hypothetical protein